MCLQIMLRPGMAFVKVSVINEKENAEHLKIIAFQDNHGFRNSREDIAKKIIDWITAIPKH